MARWKPQQGEKYYCVDSVFWEVDYFYWDDNINDNVCFNMGNVFQTQEEAEKALEKVKELLLSLHENNDKEISKMKYRKKPIIIEAFKFGVDCIPDWFMNEVSKNNIIMYGKLYQPLEFCEIKTLEGTMRAEAGDYIIKGVNGEIYPCKPDIFNKTYEVAE